MHRLSGQQGVAVNACGLCCLLTCGLPGFAQGPSANAAPAPNPAAAPAYTSETQSVRTRSYLKGLVSPEALIRAAAGAGILQAANTPSEWGQGSEAYGFRFANSYGQHIMRQTLSFGAASLLDEDNRYFPSERKGFGPRLLYALESTVLARRSDGTRHLSYSRIGAVIATGFISREWQPRSTDGARNAAKSIGDVFGSEAGFNVLHEFAPKLFGHQW